MKKIIRSIRELYDDRPAVVVVIVAVISLTSLFQFISHLDRKSKLAKIDEYQFLIANLEESAATERIKADNDKRPAFEQIITDKDQVHSGTFTFEITNNASAPVAKISYRAELTQYDPIYQTITSEEGWYAFGPPLQAGETRNVRIESNHPSDWPAVMTESLLNHTTGFGFGLRIVGAESTDGQSFKKQKKTDYEKVYFFTEQIKEYQAKIRKMKE